MCIRDRLYSDLFHPGCSAAGSSVQNSDPLCSPSGNNRNQHRNPPAGRSSHRSGSNLQPDPGLCCFRWNLGRGSDLLCDTPQRSPSAALSDRENLLCPVHAAAFFILLQNRNRLLSPHIQRETPPPLSLTEPGQPAAPARLCSGLLLHKHPAENS